MIVLTQKGRAFQLESAAQIRYAEGGTAQLRISRPKGNTELLANCNDQAAAARLADAMTTALTAGQKFFCVPSWRADLSGPVVRVKEALNHV